jgi:hypothetical protein
MRDRLIKLAVLAAAGGTLLQLGGCVRDVVLTSYPVVLQSIITQFLPLGVTTVA